MLSDKENLLSSDVAWATPENLYFCWNARGLYSPLQFVLRLRPDVHRALNSAPAGLVRQTDLTEDQIYAFSTYLHETIHWWQHVGTTSGLFLSLLYPAQAHSTHDHLVKIMSSIGPIKPLRQLSASPELTAQLSPETDAEINIALNNWHDIEFCKWLMLDPINIGSQINDPYFESVGHSYYFAIGAVISVIAATIDPGHAFLPNPESWETKYQSLRESDTPNFFYGSQVSLPSIGAKEIFEGQARFCQMQYLSHGSAQRLKWSDFLATRMLDGIYGIAFEQFIRGTGLSVTENLDDPVFGLFLLVCDIALNPVEGLIQDFPRYEDIITVFDPGWRFLQLCFVIREAPADFESAISAYSAEEYYSVSAILCERVQFLKPDALAKTVEYWSTMHVEIIQLLEEDKTFRFLPQNLPVRVFMGRFLRLQMDKSAAPQFFCWPGISMIPGRADGMSPKKALDLFEEHRALFVDKEDGDIYPRTFRTREAEVVYEMFNTFYGWICTYDFTRQWLVSEGSFEYDFSWLTSKYTNAEMKEWAVNHFKGVYGQHPDDYSIITAKGQRGVKGSSA